MSREPRAALPDHEIHQANKKRMQRRVVGTLAAVAAVYFLFLFPQLVLDTMLGSVSARWGSWVNLVAGAVGNGTLVWVLSFVLFASDSAFKGAGQSATWGRSIFASNAAVGKFHCEEPQASALWFKYFDTWGLEGSPNRNLLINSYSATYAARAVFYLQRALIVFVLLSIVSMAIHWRLFKTYAAEGGITQLVIHLLVIGLFLGAFAFLCLTNRLPKGDRRATGCWARVQDVFGRSRAVFVQDVLRHVDTLDAAFDRVAAIRTALIAARGGGDVA